MELLIKMHIIYCLSYFCVFKLYLPLKMFSWDWPTTINLCQNNANILQPGGWAKSISTEAKLAEMDIK